MLALKKKINIRTISGLLKNILFQIIKSNMIPKLMAENGEPLAQLHVS